MPNRRKCYLHTKDKGKMAKCCKGVIPALKIDSRTKDDTGMACME